jgi:hypothetical protein
VREGTVRTLFWVSGQDRRGSRDEKGKVSLAFSGEGLMRRARAATSGRQGQYAQGPTQLLQRVRNPSLSFTDSDGKLTDCLVELARHIATRGLRFRNPGPSAARAYGSARQDADTCAFPIAELEDLPFIDTGVADTMLAAETGDRNPGFVPFKIPMICSSVNRLRFMLWSSSWARANFKLD